MLLWILPTGLQIISEVNNFEFPSYGQKYQKTITSLTLMLVVANLANTK